MELVELLQSPSNDRTPLVQGAEKFDRICEHILSLLGEAVLLHRSGSHARAAFIAITALEETGKAVLGLHIAHPSSSTARGGALRSHPTKQLLGAGPLPLQLRSRLVQMLGSTDAERVLSMAWSGGLVQVREGAAYFDVEEGELSVPEDAVSADLARCILVFALDSFDDAIVGYTNESYRIGRAAEALLAEIAEIAR